MKLLLFVLFGLIVGATYNGVRTVLFTQDGVKLVGDIRGLEVAQDKLQADWAALLTENKALVNNSRMQEAMKQGDLQLHSPDSTQVVYLDNK